MSCSITALLIHWILALRARRSVASLADDVDVASARKQNSFPCSRAFFDWSTKEMRWGCSPRSVGEDMGRQRKRRQWNANSGLDAYRATLPLVWFGLVTLALYAMADYLDARVRYRSESVNTEVSSTLPSSSPLATPFINAKPTPLLSTNCPTNTILKSHGRPPWYCYCRGFSHL